MKKFYKNIMLAAVAVLGMTTFSACGSDNDEPVGEEKIKSGKFVYTYYMSDEVFKVADITITYTDCNGKETTESITADKCSTSIPSQYIEYNTCYTKEIKASSLPASSAFQVKWARKSGELDQEKYNLRNSMECTFTVDNGPSNVVSAFEQISTGIMADYIDRFIDSMNMKGKFAYKANADGVIGNN